MTTFLDVYSAMWVVLKSHRVQAIDVMRITQVEILKSQFAVICVGEILGH